MVDLRLYLVGADNAPKELFGEDKARLVRALSTSSRVKDPRTVRTREDLPDLERELATMLRTPADEDIADGVRYVVWPLAAVCIVP